jgi:hypothetical protein
VQPSGAGPVYARSACSRSLAVGCHGIDDHARDVDNVGVSSSWYQDKGGRGSVEGAVQGACAPGSDWSREAGDCDDSDPGVTSACEEGCGCQHSPVETG